jgi:pimeloyl-ACP methyl ester carboxylesterase
LLLLVGGALAATLTLYLAVCDLVVSSSLTAVRTPPGTTPVDAGLVAEEVRFDSAEDRIPLAGWLLSPAQISAGNRAIVLIHGLSCNSWTGAQQDIARAHVEAGFTVLVFDLRGHGRSGGDLLGLGWHERRDVRAAVDLLLERGFKAGSIGLHGVSYGAATALLSAASIPEVGAVVADSAFADVRDVMDAEIERGTGVPSSVARILLRPGLALVARLRHSLDLDAIPPDQAVADIAPRPILFIHGEEDDVIPVAHGYRLKAASRNCDNELWIIPGGHTEGVRMLPKGCEMTEPSPTRRAYLSKVVAFFEESLR